MAYVPIAKGTLNWDGPLNTALAQLDSNTSSVLASSLQAANNLADLTNVATARSNLGLTASAAVGGLYYNVKDYGALGNGVADDTTAINNAITAATPNGGTVIMPAGVYVVSSMINIPASVTVMGAGSTNPVYLAAKSTVVKPTSGFSAAGVFQFTSVSHTQTVGGALRNLSIDGSNIPSSSGVVGVYGFGPVYLVRMSDLYITGMPGWGILTVIDSGATGAQYPFWWWVRDVMIENCGQGGVNITSMTDATWDNVYVIQCGKGPTVGPGWSINWAGNSTFTNCRAEWCGTHGFLLSGAWWTGTGSGGMAMNGCSTDRNEQDGLHITATGNGALLIQNIQLRRDGRNAKTGGGGFAGLNILAATIPIVIGTISVFPGVDDDGTGTNSPQIGITLTGATLATSINSGYVQANTTALVNTATGGFNAIGPGLVTAIGTPASPGTYAGGSQSGTFTYTASSATFNGGDVFTQGNLDVFTAGKGVKVSEGANGKQGTATLNGTTNVVVANTNITANSRILLTIQARGAVNPPGSPYVVTRTAGTSFTIASTVASDNSTVAYFITEPG